MSVRTSQTVRDELAMAKAELAGLRDAKATLEERLKEVDGKIRTLAGSGFSRDQGRIGNLSSELRSLEKAEHAASLPLAVWQSRPQIWDRILKVTPKQIHLIPTNGGRAWVYSRETGHQGRGYFNTFGVLDVPATVAAWEKWRDEQEVADG